MSITEELTPFERDLRARDLLDVARQITNPFGLRPEDLRHNPRARTAPPVVAEARARFARHLRDNCHWTLAMIAALMSYKSRHMVFYLLGEGEGHRVEASQRRAAKFAGKGEPRGPR